MDMTISSQGSYDVALEMRDTTGAVFPQGKTPDCSAYSDPAALGVPEGTTIKAEPITGDDGLGCQVNISGVKVPQASAAEPPIPPPPATEPQDSVTPADAPAPGAEPPIPLPPAEASAPPIPSPAPAPRKRSEFRCN